MTRAHERAVAIGFLGVSAIGWLIVSCGVPTTGTCEESNTCASSGEDGGGDASFPDVASPGSPDVVADTNPDSPEEADVAAAGPVDGHTVAAGPDPYPIPGAHVAIVDATGTRFEVVSNAQGAFHFDEVVAPYDVVGFGDEFPVVHMGVRTRNPRIVLATTIPAPDAGPVDAAASVTRHAHVTMPMSLPACEAGTCSYFACLGSGQGLNVFAPNMNCARTVYAGTGQQVAFDVDWNGPDSANTVARVLAVDATSTAYAFGGLAITLQDGATMTTQPLVAAAVPNTGILSIIVNEVDIPSTWSAPSLSVRVRQDGFVAELVNGKLASVSVPIPDLVGATLDISASVADSTGEFGASSVQTNLPVSTSNESIALARPPLFTSPTPGATLSTTSELSWQASTTEVLYYATLFPGDDAGASKGFAYVVTAGTAISLERLTKLGVDLPVGITKLLFLERGKIASIDAVLDEQILAVADGSRQSNETLNFTLIQ